MSFAIVDSFLIAAEAGLLKYQPREINLKKIISDNERALNLLYNKY